MSWIAFGLFPLRTLGSSETKRFICSSASLRTLVQSWAEPGADSAGRVMAGLSTIGNSEGTAPDDPKEGMPEEGMPVADLVSLTGAASRASAAGTTASCSGVDYSLLSGYACRGRAVRLVTHDHSLAS